MEAAGWLSHTAQCPPGERAGRELCWTVHKDWFRVALTPELAIAGLHTRRTKIDHARAETPIK